MKIGSFREKWWINTLSRRILIRIIIYRLFSIYSYIELFIHILRLNLNFLLLFYDFFLIIKKIYGTTLNIVLKFSKIHTDIVPILKYKCNRYSMKF